MFIKYENEIWKDIKDTDGRYRISNYGRVASVFKTYSKLIGHNHQGVKYVNIYSKLMPIHHLVLEHFSEQERILNEIGFHIDFNKSNNWINNLEWMSIGDVRRLHHSIKRGKRGVYSLK